MKKYKCLNCGYVHNGDLMPDFLCPKCYNSKFKQIVVPNLEKLMMQKLKQRLSKSINVEMVRIKSNNPSIQKDKSRCIKCGKCSEVCKNIATCFKPENQECVNCGQCALYCPTYSITEKFCYREVRDIPANKIKICSIAPAVYSSFGEEVGCDSKLVRKKLVTALKRLGFNYVFDLCFGADLTTIEEATELIKRLKTNRFPMFTSCCPAWVKLLETFQPKKLKMLTTAKSPIAMQNTIIKTHFKDIIGANDKDIVHVMIAPCTAKKMEIARKDMLPKTDYVLTVRELSHLLELEGIDFNTLEDSEFDGFGIGSGSGVIFGNSGGVMQSVIRTSYHLITGEKAPEDLFKLKTIQGLEGIKTANINLGQYSVNVGVVSGLSNAKKLLEKMDSGEIKIDYLEVMACPGGCNGGGGQPKENSLVENKMQKRIDLLYRQDGIMKVRSAEENPDINKLYKEFIGKPGGTKAQQLLHLSYVRKKGE